MNQMECVKGLKYLGLVFSKEFTQDECVIYYEHLEEYSYEVFRAAIKSLSRTSKYLPKLAEIISECEKRKVSAKSELIDYMQKKGYFRSATEYEKVLSFINRDIIPEWFREDMKVYYKMMLREQTTNRLGTKAKVELLE